MDRRGISELLHIKGMYDLLDGLRSEHPRLSMDNCASGGRRIDIEMSRRMVPLHRTDWQPQGPVQTSTPAQGIKMGLSQWVPLQGPSYGTPGVKHQDLQAACLAVLRFSHLLACVVSWVRQQSQRDTLSF